MTIVVYRSNYFSLCYTFTQVTDNHSVAFFGLYDVIQPSHGASGYTSEVFAVCVILYLAATAHSFHLHSLISR